MSNAVRIKCRRDYMTSPVPGFGTPERVRVLRRDAHLPDYYIVRLPARYPGIPGGTVAMHESHIGQEAS